MNMEPGEIKTTDRRNSAGWGAGAACMLHLLQWPMLGVSCGIAMQPPAGASWPWYAFMAWGATQFLYLGPLLWWLKRKGFHQAMKGVLIVAGIGILLNGACDALMRPVIGG